MRLTQAMRTAFVRDAMNDVPQIDYDEQIRSTALKVSAAALPPKVKALWNDKELRGFVAVEHYYTGHTNLQLPGLSQQVIADIEAAVKPLEALRTSQRKEREALSLKLRSVAYSVSTRKALVDVLPEFEKYLPPDDIAVARSMPVVTNVVSDFVKAGWPKGHKPKATQAK